MAAPRIDRADRLLLVGLLPIWLLVYALHVGQVAGAGLRELPVNLQAAAGPEARWEVASHRLDLDRSGLELRVGDRITRVGPRDVRKAGRFEIQARAIGLADRDGWIDLGVSDAGEPHSVRVRIVGPPAPWSRAPGLVVFVITGIIVLLRATDRVLARRFFLATMAVAVLLTPFPGGSTTQALAHYWTLHLVGGVALALAVDLMRRLPPELPPERRFSRLWAYLAALAWYAPRFIPVADPMLAQVGVHVVDAGFAALLCAMLARNYRRSNPIGRRRLRWLLFGFALALVSFLVLAVAAFVDELNALFPVLQAASPIALGLVPFWFLIAIVRYNFLDIDRLLSQAAAALVAVAVLMVGLLLLMPGLAEMISTATGAPANAARLVASVAIAGLVTLGGWRLRPFLDRALFPEHRALVEGVETMSGALAECRNLGSVASLLAQRLPSLLGCDPGPLYARTQDGFVRVTGAEAPPALVASSEGWLRALEQRSRVLCARETGAFGRSGGLAEADRERMRTLGFAAVVPLRRDSALTAFVALGAKRTGDVYTPTDIALLSLIGDRASAQLERFDHSELLREGRALADALSLEKEAALRASSEKTRFLATASHDLRQPVHALGLLIEALSDLVRQPEHAALEPLVDQVAAAARSVDELVHGLLDLSRLDAGVLEPERADVDLGRLLDVVVREVERFAAGKGLALRCVPTTVWVRSDPLLLRRIVQNLLANAVHYTETGRVLIGVRRSRGEVRIEVHDTGPGFTPIQQERMFDEYQRLTTQPGERAHPGLGLGLAIVQRLASLLGHALAARSIPSRGSCFTLRLDRVEAVRPTPANPDAGAAFAGLRVLVVDDEPAVREAMRALLEGLGCRVFCASSTADALAGVRGAGFEPSVILADYWLGDGDTGLQTLQSVKAALGRTVPGVLISADSNLDLPEGCELLVLRKPVAPMRLRAAISHVLRGSER